MESKILDNEIFIKKCCLYFYYLILFGESQSVTLLLEKIGLPQGLLIIFLLHLRCIMLRLTHRANDSASNVRVMIVVLLSHKANQVRK